MGFADSSSAVTWQRRVEDLVRQAIALETKLDAASLDNTTTFEEYGIESVMVVAITRRLEEHFGELAKTLFFEFQSIGELAAYLAEEFPAPQATAPAPATAPVQQQVEVPPPLPAAPAQPPAMPPVPTAAAQPQPVAAAPVHDDPIAIIGMAGRFPMAENIDEFWDNLVAGRNCISEVPPELWDWREYWTTEKGVEGKSYTRWGGFMNDIDKFDPLFFNISNLEANSLDPQERLFLQTVYHTIEDAGYARETLAGRRIGVYAGAMWSQYQLYGADTANAGSSYSSIANRASYWFNFTGPSIGLDTMCSSSLTTVHLACESLKRGETEMAIAGGVNVTTHPNKYLFLSKTGFASTEGLCRAYGDGGDGYVPGDGVGALLLKPLSAAERDGDRIYGIIRASVINHGGKANAYTVPNPKLQTALIREALDAAGIDARTITCIEGHGTGTALGDPIEVRALTQAFGEHTEDTGYCALGSVKSNVGHLESAAGFAGIAKVLLQMRHRQLVPSLHAETLNPNIDFSKTPFVVQRTLAPWHQITRQENGREVRVPRRAGISSFGAGGANAHLIIEEHMAPAAAAVRPPQGDQLFVFSAKNQEQLQAVLRRFLATLDAPATATAKQDTTGVLAAIAVALDISVQLLDAGDSWVDLGLDDGAADRLGARLATEFGVTLTGAQVRAAETIGHLCAQVLGEGGAPASEAERFERTAYTLQVGREALPRRVAIQAASFAALRDKLQRVLAGEDDIEGCWTTPRGSRDKAQAAGAQDRDFLRGLVQGRRWAKLGKLWTQGTAIAWADGYTDAGLRRIDLPLYPFARERCWVQTAGKRAAVATGLAAALDARRSLDSGLHFDLAGSAFASTANLAVVGQAADYHGAVRALADVAWQPVGAAAQRTLILGAGTQGASAQVVDGAGEALGAARLMSAAGMPAPVAAGTDVGHWYRQCERRLPAAVPVDGCTIAEPAAGTAFALGRYTLQGRGGDWENAAVLLDAAAALMAAAGLAPDFDVQGELAADHVELVSTPPASGVLFLRLRAGGGFDADVLDEGGRICVAAQGMRRRRADPLFERMFHAPVWEPADAAQLQAATTAPEGSTLIVYPAAAAFVAAALKERLGGAPYEIVLDARTDVLSARSWSVAPGDVHALPACLAHVGDVGTVYFLGGLNLDRWHPRTGKEFDALQEASVVLLLRLVQAIEAGNAARRRWALRVVSNGVFGATEGDTIQPFTAALAGLAKALPNELPHVGTQYFDVALAEGSSAATPALLADLDRIVAGVADGAQLALRDGAALQRVLRPLALAPAAAPVLRDSGVYVIVGGAGNVGMRITEYLANHSAASVAWVGRRPADDDGVVAAIGAVAAAAGRLRYFAADVGDDRQLAQAIGRIEAEMGPLRGVFHSAMTFAGGRLASMDEQDFRAALQAKTAGSHALYRALMGRQIDFLMFFSSGEAFVGNKGWGAYTAACNFQDAFALHLRQEAAWPVHVVNWGFWEGNDRGDPELLRAKGIYPLNGEQGGEAIVRIVAAGQGQAMALNVSDAVLERMGVRLPERAPAVDPAPAPLPAAVQADKVISQIAQGSRQGHVQAALTPEAVAESVRAVVADTLMIEREKIDLDADLADFGVDSLIVVNLHRALEELAGTLPATLFLNYQTLREVAEYLVANHVEQALQLLGGGTTAVVEADAPPAAEPVAPPEPATAPALPPLQAGIKVLRTIAPDDVEAFLASYGERYREGTLATAGEEAPVTASPAQLRHLLVEVPSCPQVEVFVTGQGTPLLLMPAVALTVPVWLRQVTSLRDRHQLIVIHAPGYGLSKGIRDATTAGVARVFSEVLHVLLPGQPAHVVSSCFGSIAASYLAHHYAPQVASLTMVGGFYDGADLPPVAGADLSIEEIMQMIQVVSGSLKLDFDTVAGQWDEDDPRRVDAQRMGELLVGSQCANPLVAMRYLNEMITLSTLPWVEALRQPVQFMFGDLDTVIRPLHSQTMHDSLPGSKLVQVAGAGHYPFLTHAAEFDRLLLDFLQTVAAGTDTALTID